MPMMAHRAFDELRRREHPGQLEGDQQDRELEGHPEQTMRGRIKPYVVVRARICVRAGPRCCSATQGVGEDQVRQAAPSGEQADGGDDEGDGVPLLVRL